MKKIFIALMLLCSPLFAEEFRTGSYISVSMERTTDIYRFSKVFITAVLPYENGYLVKFSEKNTETLELFVTKGFEFYTYHVVSDEEDIYYVFKKHTVTEISPNKFSTKTVEFYE